ncbi:MAG: helix-hairpin-helix domain-containing protein [Candidatus Thorarchaeota archaeon]|nr:helix-hairpin-helix domain-containing protein [Candidatus Thorarchaeota archaeon]
MSPSKNDSGLSTLTIISIAIFVIIGIALWWYNTVAAILILILSFASVAMLFWKAFSEAVEQSAGFSGEIRRERGAQRLRLSDIENRMKAALEQSDSDYDNIMTDYDYPNLSEESIADYDTEIPVTIIDGIEGAIAENLENIGIEDLDELAVADPEEVSNNCKVSRQEAEDWIMDAKLIFVGAEISSLISLSMEDPNKMKNSITKAIRTATLKVPIDFKLPQSKIQRWINRANKIVSEVDVNEIQRWLEESDR